MESLEDFEKKGTDFSLLSNNDILDTKIKLIKCPEKYLIGNQVMMSLIK